MIDEKEVLQSEREKVEIMKDAISQIEQYMRDDNIYDDKGSLNRVVNLSLKLRAYSSSFAQTARIVEADKGWDELD